MSHERLSLHPFRRHANNQRYIYITRSYNRFCISSMHACVYVYIDVSIVIFVFIFIFIFYIYIYKYVCMYVCMYINKT